ncbi:unnamed protein product [Linum tenue]|uniref:Uncharacterized protein n=1 Tax=Linum tenue TaxID=586396 RepID=A0AAV0M2M8_9ROSI|nr:unnamed protein product [Linum tenue]
MGPPGRASCVVPVLENVPGGSLSLDRRLASLHGFPRPLLQVRAPIRDPNPRPSGAPQWRQRGGGSGWPFAEAVWPDRRAPEEHDQGREEAHREAGKGPGVDCGRVHGGPDPRSERNDAEDRRRR